MQGDILPFGLRRNPVWRDSSNVKRERAVRDGYGIERMSSDSGILLGIILYFCHFLSDFMGLTIIFRCYVVNSVSAFGFLHPLVFMSTFQYRLNMLFPRSRLMVSI